MKITFKLLTVLALVVVMMQVATIVQLRKELQSWKADWRK
jgi:hypothetical protein